MRVELSGEQQLLRKSVAGVLKRKAPFSRIREWTEAGDTTAADELAVSQGWTGIGLAEELGGQGGGILELAVMAQELGATATPWDRLLGSALALRALGAADTEAARELAGAVAEGDRAAVLCLDGRRIPAPWPEATLSSGELTLPADYVPGAQGAELIVPVATEQGIRLWLVGSGHVSASSRALIDRTRSLAAVELNEAPGTDLGAISAEAFARVAAGAAVLVAADALGAAATLLEMTVAYVGERQQFGVAVGSFQAVKHAAATMLVDVEAARSAVSYAAWAVDSDNDDARTWASIAKVHACGSAPHVADKALFLHGAVGYTWDNDLQFCFKRAKSDELLFGAPDAYRDRIADELELIPALAPAG